MNRWQIIRIVLALCGIFAAGVVTGRFTAPAPPPARDPQDNSRGGPVVVATGDGLAVNSAQIIRYYTRLLKLTPAQRAEVIPLIRRGMAEMQTTAPGSPERLERIRAVVTAVRPHLTPSQQQTLDQTSAASEKEWLSRHSDVEEPDPPAKP